ncbi:MAG: hypothetical protein R3F20_03085 [Planctomycetota bacterium]
MSQPSPTGRPSRLRRLRRWTLRIIGILAAVLVLVYLFRDPLLGRPLGRLVAGRLGEVLGGRFEIDRIGGTWFTGLEVRGLRTIEAPTEGPVAGIAFDRLSLRYRLLDAFGPRPETALRSLVIEGLELDLDLTRPAPEPPDPGPTDLRALADRLPATLPEVDVAGRVGIRTAAGDFAVRTLELETEGETLTLALDGVAAPEDLPVPLASTARLSLVREAARRFRLETSPLVAGIELEPVTASIGDDGALDLESALALLGSRLGLSLHLAADQGALAARAKGEGLSLAARPDWADALLPADVPRPTAGAIGLDLSADRDAAGALRIGAELAVLGLAIDRFEGLDIRAALAADAEGYAASTLTVDGEGLRIEGRELRFGPDGQPRAVGALSLALSDLRSRAAPFLGADAEIPWPRDPVDLALELGGPLDRPLELRSLAITTTGARLDGEGELVLPPLDGDWRDLAPRLALRGRVDDPGALASGLGPDPLPAEGSLVLVGEVTGSLGAPRAELRIEVADLVVDGRAAGDGELEVRWSEDVLDIAKLRLAEGPVTLNASGRIAPGAGRVEGLDFRASVAALDRLGPLLELPRDVAGALEAKGEIAKDAGPWTEGWRATVAATGRELAIEGRPIGRLALAARAEGDTVTVARLELEGPSGRIDAAGTILLGGEVPGVAFPRLEVSDLDVSLAPVLLADLPAVAGRLDFRGEAEKARGLPWEEARAKGALDLRDVTLDGRPLGALTARLEAEGRRFRLPELRARGDWGEVDLAAEAALSPAGGARRASRDWRAASASAPCVSPIRRASRGPRRARRAARRSGSRRSAARSRARSAGARRSTRASARVPSISRRCPSSAPRGSSISSSAPRGRAPGRASRSR